MNGRGLTSSNSNSQKNLIFNNIRYVKPIYFVKDDQKETRNLYYDSNPYFLNNNPLNNRAKGIYNTSRNSNVSRDVSDTSSQRSGKVVRANGLRLAQKPRIMKGVVPQRQSSLSQSRNNEQTRRLFDRNIDLQQENRLLRQQNNRLRENMRIMEQMHKKQVESLNMKFQTLLKRTEQLQFQVEEEEHEWRKKVEEFSHVKTNNYSQFSTTNNNSGSLSSTPKQYFNPTVGIQNNGHSQIRK